MRADLIEALKAAEKALRPFYNAVFNDNGDITVTGGYDYEEAIAGYFAYRKIEDALASQEPVAFQARVQPWMTACFGEEISRDKIERNHRFIEEALELVQANGCTRSEAHQLVDYVYDRPAGEIHQEIGGVMVTLAALCLAIGEDMDAAAETELARIWTKVEKIRAKQAAKPKHSPLPQHVVPVVPVAAKAEAEGWIEATGANPFGGKPKWELRQRDGSVIKTTEPWRNAWEHLDQTDDIVAYRQRPAAPTRKGEGA